MAPDIETIDLGFVNAYLLRAKGGFILIDTGLPQQWQALDRALGAAACVPGTLALVIVTHGDIDHYGNCRRLQKEYGAKVAVHREDASTLRTGHVPRRSIKSPAVRILVGLMHFVQLLAGKPKGIDCEPDILLEDGQDLGSFGLDAKVLALGGHTRGSIAILTASGDFFAGDVLSNRTRPAPSFYIENTADYRRSIERVQAMAGSIRMVYPGHGKAFAGEALAGISL